MQVMKTWTHYKPTFAIDAFIHARSGMSDQSISYVLGVAPATFHSWKEKNEELRYALQQARSFNGSTDNFIEYVYKRLPEELKQLWDKLKSWYDLPNGLERVQALLGKQPVKIRQELFMHAMVQSNFNASEACRKLGLSMLTVQSWGRDDPNFPKLLDELNTHKKNFFEGSLIGLVKQGNVLATIYANRTINRDRGYSDKQQIQIEHNINIKHSVVPIEQLNLPLEIRIQIRDAIRSVKNVTPDPNPIELPPTQNKLLELIGND